MQDHKTSAHPAQPQFTLGWRQVALCFVTLAATGMIAATWSIVAVPLAHEFKPSREMVGFTMTVLSGTGALLTPLLGMVMDRVSVRRLMLLGSLLLASGYMAMSFANNFKHILLIFGLLIAPGNVLLGPVAATVLLSRWFHQQRGRALGIAIAGIAAGGFTFPFIIQGLLDTMAWRQAFQGLGLILLILTVPATLLAIDRPEDRGLHADGAETAPQSTAPAPAQDDKPLFASIVAIITDPAFWMIAITVAIVTAGMKGVVTNLSPLATDTGISASKAATLVSVYAGCSFIAKLNFAMLADRLGPRILMLVSLAGFAVGMASLTQAQLGYMAIAISVGIIGLSGGLMVPIESYIAPRVFGQKAVGRAMGLLAGTIMIALLASPWLFGKIFDLTGSYRGILWSFSGMAVLALLWTPFLRLAAKGE